MIIAMEINGSKYWNIEIFSSLIMYSCVLYNIVEAIFNYWSYNYDIQKYNTINWSFWVNYCYFKVIL